MWIFFKQKDFKTIRTIEKQKSNFSASVTLWKRSADQTKYCTFCLPVNALLQTPVLKKSLRN